MITYVNDKLNNSVCIITYMVMSFLLIYILHTSSSRKVVLFLVTGNPYCKVYELISKDSPMLHLM